LGDAAGVAAAAFVIGGPALLTRDGFMVDFTTHMWLVSIQEHAISAHLTPAYFVNAPGLGVFYPLFMFYGGTLYAAVGGIAALIGGNVVVAYVGAILLAVASAYGGMLWLARQLGVRSWMAHAPAIAFTASAINVSNLYGYGGWTEFIATSTIPLMLAAGWRLARAAELEVMPAALFVIAAVLFAGSHTLSLLLGSIVLVAVLVCLRVTLGARVGAVDVSRGVQIFALFALGVAVDAWFLLPTVLNGSTTQIAHYGAWSWKHTASFNTPGMLFNPLRAVPAKQGLHAFFVQAPEWFLLWVVGVGAHLRSRTARLGRVALGLALVLLALLALIMVGPLWDAIPLTGVVQFPYRLNTYVAFVAAALVLVSVLAVEAQAASRMRVGMAAGLGCAIAISVGLCLWQLWVPDTHGDFLGARSYDDRSLALASVHRVPHSFFAFTDYADASVPVVKRTRGADRINPARVNEDTITLIMHPPPGRAPFVTDIAGGPDAVALSGGIVRVGRTRDGLTVARRAGGHSRGPVRVTLRPAGGPVSVGRTVSLVAVASLVVLLALGILSRARRFALCRRARSSSADPLEAIPGSDPLS
jgi:hypothetical protein